MDILSVLALEKILDDQRILDSVLDPGQSLSSTQELKKILRTLSTLHPGNEDSRSKAFWTPEDFTGESHWTSGTG